MKPIYVGIIAVAAVAAIGLLVLPNRPSAADELAKQKMEAVRSVCEEETTRADGALRENGPAMSEEELKNSHASRLKDCITHALAK